MHIGNYFNYFLEKTYFCQLNRPFFFILLIYNKMILHVFDFRGNYEQFEKTKNEKLKNQQREYDAQMQHRQHVQEFIDRFRYNANRAALVQSKIKMLEKLYGSFVNLCFFC